MTDASTIPAPKTERSKEALPQPPRIPWEFFAFSTTADPNADPLRDVFPLAETAT